MENSTKLLALLDTSYRWKYLYKVGKNPNTGYLDQSSQAECKGSVTEQTAVFCWKLDADGTLATEEFEKETL